ncbi:MAG: hypothetical protein AVDCRST_MAG49-955 [uncultured Thermomicrobiales bacterium]|uniref:Uncharacterized protein n=1 Tax=uncultured Thermomicrobiales bacterium TaxID=1645740 RepID=A0A6J4U9T8_9BACT|nr:MAG: hypothetical protein AVDCRST_MAG49-955 [uncultured Thermomicrobiales bacterium]
MTASALLVVGPSSRSTRRAAGEGGTDLPSAPRRRRPGLAAECGGQSVTRW